MFIKFIKIHISHNLLVYWKPENKIVSFVPYSQRNFVTFKDEFTQNKIKFLIITAA